MNVNKSILLIFITCLLTISLKAQTTLNLYPLNGVVGVKFFSEKLVSLEPRLNFQLFFNDKYQGINANTDIFTTIKFLREDRFHMYSGLGLGMNIRNNVKTSFSGTIPVGATYYINDNKRIAFIGECGIKVTPIGLEEIKSYAIVGIQIRLSKSKVIVD